MLRVKISVKMVAVHVIFDQLQTCCLCEPLIANLILKQIF